MSTALAFDAQHRPPATAAARVRELAPMAGVGPAEPPAGWSGQRRPRSFWLLVVGVHLFGGWALAHSLAAPVIKPRSEPIQVRVIEPPPPPPPPHVEVPPMKLPAVPLVAVIPPPQIEVAPPVMLAQAVAAAPVVPVAAAPAPAAAPMPAVVAAAAGTAPRQLPPSAVHYLVPPRPVMPRMSRRLGESGTVVLHIAVDAHGRLKSVVVKKSSGFDRLDQQAMLDMRGASFAPYLEQGQPVEWEADAGLQYELSSH